MAWSRAFQKCIIFHFLDKFFLQTITKLYLMTFNKFWFKICGIFQTNEMRNKITILALF